MADFSYQQEGTQLKPAPQNWALLFPKNSPVKHPHTMPIRSHYCSLCRRRFQIVWLNRSKIGASVVLCDPKSQEHQKQAENIDLSSRTKRGHCLSVHLSWCLRNPLGFCAGLIYGFLIAQFRLHLASGEMILSMTRMHVFMH